MRTFLEETVIEENQQEEEIKMEDLMQLLIGVNIRQMERKKY